MFTRGAKAYVQVDVETSISTADPVRLIVVLYEGAISAIVSAKGEMERRNVAQKARLINKSIDIIEGLRNALSFDQGGDIAVSLNDLYLYMIQQLSVANLRNDPVMLDEVKKLLAELHGAWEIVASRPQSMEASPQSKSSTTTPT